MTFVSDIAKLRDCNRTAKSKNRAVNDKGNSQSMTGEAAPVFDQTMSMPQNQGIFPGHEYQKVLIFVSGN